MCRDDELRVLVDELVHASHQRELAVHRQRRLGLVEEVEAARAETVDRDVEERLAVRLLVQRPLEDVLPSRRLDRVARLKTLSARRKNELSGASAARSSSSRRWSCECDERVREAELCMRPPPSGLSFMATAIASTSVDLPLPFSPTRKVTRGSSSIRSPAAEPGARTSSRRSISSSRRARRLGGVDERCRRGRRAHALIMPRVP